MSPKYGQRIRTPTAAGTGGGPPGAAATVRVGPDYGTTNQNVELHLSHGQESNVYPVTEEVHIGPETQKVSYVVPNQPPSIADSASASGTFDGTGVTITVPASTQNGDFLLAILAGSRGNGGPVFTAPAGWTPVSAAAQGSGNIFRAGARVYSRFASGDAGVPYTFTGNASGPMEGVILRIVNVGGVDTSVGNSGTDDTSENLSFTTARNGEFVFAISAIASNNSAVLTATPDPTMTPLFDFGSLVGSLAVSLSIDFLTQNVAGVAPQTTTTWSAVPTTGSWASIQLAVTAANQAEELHIGPEIHKATYSPPMTDELHLSMLSENVIYPITEELHIGPETQKQTYNTVNEELHISGTVTGPPQFETAVVQVSSNSSSLPFTGITTVVGTYLLAEVGILGSNSTWTAPAGWTLVVHAPTAGAGGLDVFGRAVAAADPTSWTFLSNAAASAAAGAILSFTAVDAATPTNVNTGQTTGNSTVLTAPSVTVTKANTMTVCSGFQNTPTATPATFTAASPYVQRVAQIATGPVNAANLEVCTHVQATSGASAAATINTAGLVAAAWNAVTVALFSTRRVIA